MNAITRIFPVHLELWEDQVRRLLSTVAEKTDQGVRFNNDYLLGEIKKGNKQLWTVIDDGKIQVIGITSLHETDECKWCVVEIAASTEEVGDHWTESITYMENWASRSEFCTRFYVDGRLGWKKVLAPQGYEPVSLLLGKDI